MATAGHFSIGKNSVSRIFLHTCVWPPLSWMPKYWTTMTVDWLLTLCLPENKLQTHYIPLHFHFFFYHVYSPGATAVSEKSILWISVSRLLFSHSCCKTFPQLSGLIMGYCLHLVCYRRLWHQPRSDVTFES